MRIDLVIVVLLIVSSVFGDTYDGSVWRAMSHGAEFEVLIKVVDSDGSPVADAKCSGWMYVESAPEHGSRYSLRTDTNGYVRVGGKCGEWFSLVVRKEGYYRTMFEVRYPVREVVFPIVDGKWQPYGETRTVVLKKIRNPVEMVETPNRVSKVISYGKWYGYDMVRADWMPPYGEGESIDVLVRLGLTAINDTSDFRTTMELCFTNKPYAGVYEICKDNWSEMKSTYYADTNVIYKSEISFVFERHPHMPVIDTRLSENSCLIFRIRTKTDACGKLISAHYGKIYGLWSFFGAMTSPQLFFNPTPNDTNLEDAETARKSRLAYKQQIEFERRRKAQRK